MRQQSILDCAKREMQREIHSTLAEQITDEFMKDIRERVHEVVRKEVEKYSIGALEGIKDVMRMRDEIHVMLHYKEEQP